MGFLGGQNMDAITAEHPHMDDPRFLSITNQMNHCLLRFTMFTRCARELGEEHTRCKYQYFRAQCACPESQLEDWMEHRELPPVRGRLSEKGRRAIGRGSRFLCNGLSD